MATRKKAARGKAAGRRASLKRRKQPETLRLRTVVPSYTVNDVEKSLAWYRDVLGFVVKERWEQEGKLVGADLRAGAVSIMIGQDDWARGRDRLKGVGTRIYCRTVQDLDKLAATIKARGGVLLHDPKDQPWGMRDFGIEDPDGFKITIWKPIRKRR
jgi:uncharacterized glyoxalase superfamily protein PhnB